MALPTKTLAQHLDPAATPKRILALDGGGVRGALTLVVRASTAAPYYFKPYPLHVTLHDAENSQPIKGTFADGGVSTANNPALQALMVDTLNGFRLNWQMGEDKLLVASLGTGRPNPNRRPTSLTAKHAVNSLLSVMDDAAALVETTMQWMSEGETARTIDSEIEKLEGDIVGISSTPMLTYRRYDVEFSTDWFKEHLDCAMSEKEVSQLEEIGTLAASRQLHDHSFPDVFDLS